MLFSWYCWFYLNMMKKKTTLYALKLFKILDEHIPHKLVEYTDILY